MKKKTKSLPGAVIWASAQENLSPWVCEQQRRRPDAYWKVSYQNLLQNLLDMNFHYSS